MTCGTGDSTSRRSNYEFSNLTVILESITDEAEAFHGNYVLLMKDPRKETKSSHVHHECRTPGCARRGRTV